MLTPHRDDLQRGRRRAVGEVRAAACDHGAASGVLRQMGEPVSCAIGAMTEFPQALRAGAGTARSAEFFAFGTNDLTRAIFGLSRDDARRFLPSDVEKGIFREDPFQLLDQDGVGRLIRMAVDEGKKTRPGLKVGTSGEHGRESRSVKFCHQIGLGYMSCSPYHVPIARLDAAHAALEQA